VATGAIAHPSQPEHAEAHTHPYSPSVRTPLYPVVPLLFIASSVFLIVNSLLDASSRVPTVITLVIVLVGAPLYYTTIGRPRNAP
jgi:hypothetical protein